MKTILTIGMALTVTSAVIAQTTPAPQPSICNRACWGASSSSCSTSLGTLSRAIIHHTAGSGDFTTNYETAKSKVRGVQNLHKNNNGWCDIGYHFMVSNGGHIFEVAPDLPEAAAVGEEVIMPGAATTTAWGSPSSAIFIRPTTIALRPRCRTRCMT